MQRKNRNIKLQSTPELVERGDGFGNKIKIPTLGVVSGGKKRIENYNFPGAIFESLRKTGGQILMTGRFLWRLAFGQEDKCNLGGPVKIADMTGKVAKGGWAKFDSFYCYLVYRHWCH